MSSQTTVINDRFQVALHDQTAFVGQGGMGAVYRGWDRLGKQAVAVKILKEELTARDPDLVQRFEREGQALRQLNHPNIVKMLEACYCDGTHYLIMEYVSGGSLRDVLDRERKLSIQRTLYIALDLADALTRAHRLRILHRDIKPDNVLIAEDGTPRLTDFGMARLDEESHITQDGAIVGTMAYIAPEVYQGQAPDERADIWSFGVMLYEMLMGQRPFPQTQAAALIHAIVTQPLPEIESLRPDLSTALVDLLYRMLAKDREARIPSVRLVGAELEAILRGATTSLQQVVSVDDSTGRFELSTTEFPAVPSSSRTNIPHNLPKQPTAFVGRAQELADLKHLMQGDNRLITILGSGGMGKTRLALQLAEQGLRDFPDGVYFVPLASLQNEDFIIPAIAEQLQFTFSSDDTLADLQRYLQTKHMLLVLDNFEHVMAGADLIAELLAAAPELTVLVTSRERLRLRGEQSYEINGMILPREIHEMPDLLAEFPATKLFLQSARRVLPDFELRQDNVHSVARIIRLVQGLPLGIELAAAWVDALSLEEIVEEIERSADFLETDLRDVPERHRSIRALFESTWSLLTEQEKEVFMRLSVFRDGFEREAAQEVTGASLRTLTHLVNKSLLRRDPNGRYFAHVLLRQYAQERLHQDSALKMETYKAHAVYYAQFASKLAPVFNTPKEREAAAAIDIESENIRLMWKNAVEHGHFALLDGVQDTLLYFHIARSMLQEGYDAFKNLADAMQGAGEGDTVSYWRARIRQAWIAGRQGKYQEMLEIAPAADRFFQQHENVIELAYAHNQLSYAHMMLGDYEASKDCAQHAVDVLPDHRGEYAVAWFMGMGNLGYALYLMGRLPQARRIYERILEAGEQMGYSPAGVAYGKNNLGEILRDMGDVRPAARYFQEAYEIFEQTKQRRGMGFTLNNIGGLHFAQGHYQEAKEVYERSLEIHRDIGDPAGTAHSLSALGNIAASAGDYEQAKEHYRASLQIRRDMGDKRGIADSLRDLASVELNRNNLADAKRLVQESLALRREIGDTQGEAYSLANYGLVMVMLGQTDEARESIQRALQLSETGKHLFPRLLAFIGLAELQARAGHLDTALQTYAQAMGSQDSIDLPLMLQLFALTGVARIKMQQGQHEQALQLISLVLRYPRTFIAIIEESATNMLEELTQLLPPETVEQAMQSSKALGLATVVRDLVTEIQASGTA